MKQGQASESITLRDIAKAIGVSRTTVSNAFNRPDQLSPELRERVLRVAKDMGYCGPNPMARMLRTGQTGTIGLVFAEALPYAFSDQVAIALLQGVAQVCEQAQASLLIVPALEHVAAQGTIQQAVVDGFIVYGMPENSEVVARVLERKLPVVAIDYPNLKGVPSVGIDNRTAARTAAEHLIQHHHQRLAILAINFFMDGYVGFVDGDRLEQAIFHEARMRLQGYEEAIRAANLDWETIPIMECPPRYGTEGAFKAALTLLQCEPRPTGILAMSDVLAFGALRAAEQLGLVVPRDVSIVGFDGIPLASQVRPGLTTIQQPLVEKGVIAAEFLLGKNRKTSRVLETELIVRGSSGPAPPQ